MPTTRRRLAQLKETMSIRTGKTTIGARLTTAAALTAIVLAACSTNTESSDPITRTPESATTASTASGTGRSVGSTSPLAGYDTHFDTDDLTWMSNEERVITLADNATSSDAEGVTVASNTVTITEGGVYRISGSLSDGRLIVSAPDDNTVTLIFDRVSISSSTGPAVAVTSADEVTIYTESGTENSVADASGYTVDEESTPVAAIASASDLTIAGDGALNVTGNTNDGINTSDGLVITSASLTVSAVDDAIRGKDYIVVDGATITATSGGDGLKSDNIEDAERGWVLIGGGDITIAAGSDGIDAEQAMEISGGTVAITQSDEGIESHQLTISGGTIDIVASDDGLNATEFIDNTFSEDDDGSLITISGGTVTITAGSDGLDSNGSIALTGGTITIWSGQAGEGDAVDANAQVTLDGATVTANGMDITSADQIASRMGGPGGIGGPRPR